MGRRTLSLKKQNGANRNVRSTLSLDHLLYQYEEMLMIAYREAGDGEELPVRTNDQEWLVSWHLPPLPPAGTAHGAAGICVTDDGQIVLISPDGVHWDLPAGRSEGNETWEQTLRREMLEEACATVVDAQLLGFSRSVCIAGPEAGVVLVRSFWRAQVLLEPWEPEFEISHRRVVPPTEVLAHLPPVFLPIFRRALNEGGVL